MRRKLNGQRWTMDKNIQDQSDVQILQLPTAADVAAKYANISGFALADFGRWRKEYLTQNLDQKFLNDALSALAVFAAYLQDIQEAVR